MYFFVIFTTGREVGMSACIIDGKAIAAAIKADVAKKVTTLRTKGIQPGLAVILVGNDSASHTYVKHKKQACDELGINSKVLLFPKTSSESEIVKSIKLLNKDTSIHGILVQLPLPAGLQIHSVLETITPEKDIDGLTTTNMGKLVQDIPCFIPCTPQGIVVLLEQANIPIQGKHVVIVGRSNLVGKPLANLLLRKSCNATVTVCHRASQNVADICQTADILVACAGSPTLIQANMVRSGACVIDVGIHRLVSNSKQGYTITGDVDFAAVSKVAGWITPVPGGVGPMTIAMLLSNLIQATEARIGKTIW